MDTIHGAMLVLHNVLSSFMQYTDASHSSCMHLMEAPKGELFISIVAGHGRT